MLFTEASGKLIALVFNICLSIVYVKFGLITPCPLIIKDLEDVNCVISDTGKFLPSLPDNIATDLSPTLKSWSVFNIIS